LVTATRRLKQQTRRYQHEGNPEFQALGRSEYLNFLINGFRCPSPQKTDRIVRAFVLFLTLRSRLVLFSHLHLGIPRDLFTSGFPRRIILYISHSLICFVGFALPNITSVNDTNDEAHCDVFLYIPLLHPSKANFNI
jgi:hypothetical protein